MPAVEVAVLLVALGSAVVEETVAVLSSAPDAPGLAFTTKVKLAGAAGASEAIVQTIEPVAPTAGGVQLKLGPEFWVCDTKVAFAGRVSVRVTFDAVDGPA